MKTIPSISQEQYARQQRRAGSPLVNIWDLLDTVADPEIPVLSIWDMGILQDVSEQDDKIIVTITPTYSGCPAMDVIEEDIEAAIQKGGYEQVEVIKKLAPAWTTDWMTPDTQKRLRSYGIAPPVGECTSGCGRSGFHQTQSVLQVQCPQCQAKNTRMVSEFGSTACKALMQCNDCQEPFDYFKRI